MPGAEGGTMVVVGGGAGPERLDKGEGGPAEQRGRRDLLACVQRGPGTPGPALGPPLAPLGRSPLQSPPTPLFSAWPGNRWCTGHSLPGGHLADHYGDSAELLWERPAAFLSPGHGSDRPQGTRCQGWGRSQLAGWWASPALIPPELTLWTELVERHRQTRRRFAETQGGLKIAALQT